MNDEDNPVWKKQRVEEFLLYLKRRARGESHIKACDGVLDEKDEWELRCEAADKAREARNHPEKEKK